MTAVADEEVLRAAELALSVDEVVGTVEPVVAESESNAGPDIRILKGSPTDAELAALVCVFAAAAASAASAAPAQSGPVDLWGKPTMMHRGAMPFSPYAFPFLSHLRD
ncbi:acyl-CoA carboxylase subunit epsilon [Nocardia sp. CA2R105]|uniref:acyl-CoA carboxylase subunit epsilon n=1 Tax=Nocardia coffeae TaxID=2873381 RepID=UPI001CA6792F|nr:acyl-CoA carboxylase subunit epsilon [Nocardia coffeae]MBY8858119.1 acyl-CoA carboxylase subunit epsilon [Nocardia coffeae]